ncbi:hypothetical protein HYDPIDRAFT_111009 [Hydnomerulius pinastri MD-312]|uniref:Uncharacterized protein n=1 Tax=Hydnomerulius pinastri MD-312 TaxID=994086 RepID=A0A0C9W2B3_9AGAM|nr:hypothetical protein HYDPIDRAFT_111009 [Hydnomerulius pinastri MD-312]
MAEIARTNNVTNGTPSKVFIKATSSCPICDSVDIFEIIESGKQLNIGAKLSPANTCFLPASSIPSWEPTPPFLDVSNATHPDSCDTSFLTETASDKPLVNFVRVMKASRGICKLRAASPLSGPRSTISSSARIGLSSGTSSDSPQAILAKVIRESLEVRKPKGLALDAAKIVSPKKCYTSSRVTSEVSKMIPPKIPYSSAQTREVKSRSPLSRLPNAVPPPMVLPWSPVSDLAHVLRDGRWIRKFFVPPLAEGAEASRNSVTQAEIETLRALKKVAGIGVVDSNLQRCGSLYSIAVITKLRAQREQCK